MTTPDPQHEPAGFRLMREQIRATPMPAPHRARPWPRRPDRARRRLRLGLLASSGAISAIILTLVLTAGAGPGSPPAYAATVNQDRTVTITLRQFSAIGALNARLAGLNTRIRAVPAVHGCDAPVHTVSNAQVQPGPAKTLRVVSELPGALVSMTIGINTIAGRTLVIAETKSGLSGVGTVVVGPAPPCVGYAPRHPSTPFLLSP